MKITIDRFEEEIAVVELSDGKIIDCPKALLPDNAKEGSVISIMVDEYATNKKLRENTKRMNRLFRD